MCENGKLRQKNLLKVRYPGTYSSNQATIFDSSRLRIFDGRKRKHGIESQVSKLKRRSSSMLGSRAAGESPLPLLGSQLSDNRVGDLSSHHHHDINIEPDISQVVDTEQYLTKSTRRSTKSKEKELDRTRESKSVADVNEQSSLFSAFTESSSDPLMPSLLVSSSVAAPHITPANNSISTISNLGANCMRLYPSSESIPRVYQLESSVNKIQSVHTLVPTLNSSHDDESKEDDDDQSGNAFPTIDNVTSYGGVNDDESDDVTAGNSPPSCVELVIEEDANFMRRSRKQSRPRQRQQPSPTASSSADPVRGSWVTLRAHKEQLKNRGHTWKTGAWSREEIEILQANIGEYCQSRNVPDPTDIIFRSSKEDRKDFYPTISAGLNRPLFAVYRRVKRMYNENNYKGKYTPQEVARLKELRKKYGRDWSMIAQELGRSSDSVKDRCRLLNHDKQAGKWTKTEEDSLIKAVYAVTKTEPGVSVTEGISWNVVAKMVRTRSEKQCRSKWLHYLNWKASNGAEWTKLDDKLLVERVAQLEVGDENEVSWSKLTEGWPSVRSPQWLHFKWSSLKKMISVYSSAFAFCDVVQILLKLYSDECMKLFEQPKQLFRTLCEECNKGLPLHNEQERVDRLLRVLGINITTTPSPTEEEDVITDAREHSHTGDPSIAPLFVPPDPVVDELLMQSQSQQQGQRGEPPSPPSLADSLNSIVRPRTDSESNHSSKTHFDDDSNSVEGWVCDGTITLPQGSYFLTPTSSDGIYVIRSSDSSNIEDMNFSVVGDNVMVNVELASSLATHHHDDHDDVTSQPSASSSCGDDDVTLSSANTVFLSHTSSVDEDEAPGNPVFSTPRHHDVSENDDDVVMRLRNSPLSGDLLV